MSSPTNTPPAPSAPARPFGGFGVLPVAFVALTLFDLLLTATLLGTPGECFYEANPVADWVLRGAGWVGLGVFKLASAALVLAVVALLARRHPRSAVGVLAVGCAAVTIVVGYSVHLLIANNNERQILLEARELQERLAARFRDQGAFKRMSRALGAELARENVSLSAAVQELRAQLRHLRYDPLPAMRVLNAPMSDDAHLGVVLVREAGYVLGEREAAPERHLPRFRNEFQSVFGYHLPPLATETFTRWEPEEPPPAGWTGQRTD